LHTQTQILEWTASPAVALADAIYLNDRFSLDGRDPNGYVGCMWSIAGIHDMGWAERPVFGKIRFMNYAGWCVVVHPCVRVLWRLLTACVYVRSKRKFDIEAYINRVGSDVRRIKAAAKAA
jgi:deoxyribodipyrimidine photo-lyase